MKSNQAYTVVQSKANALLLGFYEDHANSTLGVGMTNQNWHVMQTLTVTTTTATLPLHFELYQLLLVQKIYKEVRTRATRASNFVRSILAIMNSIASLVARDTNTVRTFEIRGFAGWKQIQLYDCSELLSISRMWSVIYDTKNQRSFESGLMNGTRND
jgi:hypothetical protein